jgi:hypothetical protein
MDKAKDFIKGNPDKARDALEKAEDMVDERTGGTYAEHVDTASDLVADKLGLPPETQASIPDVPSEGETTLGDPPASPPR